MPELGLLGGRKKPAGRRSVLQSMTIASIVIAFVVVVVVVVVVILYFAGSADE